MGSAIKFYNADNKGMALSFHAIKYLGPFIGLDKPHEVGQAPHPWVVWYCNKLPSTCMLYLYFLGDSRLDLNDYNATRFFFSKHPGGTSFKSVHHPMQLN